MASTIRISILANALNAVRGLKQTTSAAQRAKAKMSELERGVRSVNGLNAKVSLTLKGFAQGTAQIVLAHLALDRLRKGAPDLSFGLTGIANKMTLVTAAALALTAATLPLVGAAVAFGAATLAAGAGLGLFAAVALPTIKSVTTAVGEYNTASHAFDRAQSIGDAKAMTKAQDQMRSSLGALSPAQRATAETMITMNKAWNTLSQSQAPLVLGVMTTASKTLAGIIPRLTPAISAVGGALKSISSDAFDGLAKSTGPFVNLITSQGVPAIKTLATVIGNVAVTVGHLVTAFAPLGNVILAKLGPLTAGLKNLNFDKLAASAGTFLPVLSKLLGNTGGAIGNIIKAAAPLAGPVLQALSDIAGTIKTAFGGKEIAGFVANIGKLIPALAPIIAVLVPAFAKFADIVSGQLVALMPRLLPLVTQIADAFVNVLTGLSPLLGPLLDLVGVLVSLLPVVFPIVTALRDALTPILPILGAALVALMPSVAQLAIALVQILPAVTPLIPVVSQLAVMFAGALTAAVTAVVPLITAFSTWAAGNVGTVKAIGVAIVGLAVAFNVVKGAVAAYNAVEKVWLALSTAKLRALVAQNFALVSQKLATLGSTIATAANNAVMATSRGIVAAWTVATSASTFAMIGQKIATVAGTVATAAMNTVTSLAAGTQAAWLAVTESTTLAMIGQKIALVAGTVATGAMTAAQWLLNVAMGANPIGAVILVVVALVAIIVLVATKTRFFQVIWEATWSAVKVALNATWTFIKSVGAWFAGPFADFFVNGVRNIHITIGNFVSGVVGFFVGLPGRLVQIGRDIMQGLLDGIAAGLQWVRDKIRGLGDLLPGWLKEVLGISSPSKVMHGLGRNIMQGLAGGIADQIPALKKTIGGVASTITGIAATPATIAVGITGAGAGASAGNNTFHITVNVAPTADLAAVGRTVVGAIEAHERRTGRIRLVPAL